jgi:hypothetical protein
MADDVMAGEALRITLGNVAGTDGAQAVGIFEAALHAQHMHRCYSRHPRGYARRFGRQSPVPAGKIVVIHGRMPA